MPPKKPISVERPRTSRVFRAEALKRLQQGFESENEDRSFDPGDEPVVTPLLKAAEGGITRILEALRAYDNDEARGFIGIYDSLSAKDRQYLKLEEIAYASGIGSLRLAEISQTAMFLHCQMRTKLLLSAGMPKVVETMLKQAVKAKGFADREWALKSGGILPTPKGATIAIQTNVTTEKSEADEREEPTYIDAGQRLRMIHDAVEQRRLPSPPSGPIGINSRLDQMQAETAEIIGAQDDV